LALLIYFFSRAQQNFILTCLFAKKVIIETLAFGVGYKLRGENLEGHLAAELRVLGNADVGHAAGTELFYDAVVRESLADHFANPIS
jgi:hypothetical protein